MYFPHLSIYKLIVYITVDSWIFILYNILGYNQVVLYLLIFLLKLLQMCHWSSFSGLLCPSDLLPSTLVFLFFKELPQFYYYKMLTFIGYTCYPILQSAISPRTRFFYNKSKLIKKQDLGAGMLFAPVVSLFLGSLSS